MNVQPCRQDTQHLHVKSLAQNHKKRSPCLQCMRPPAHQWQTMTSSPKHDTLKLYNTSTAASLHRAPSLLRTMFRHLLADASEMEIYLAFIAAAVSRNAWYDFTASGTDMVPHQSKLRPLIFAGGAEAMSLAMVTVTAS